MFLVTKIDKEGNKSPSFVLDLEGMALLLKMATPFRCEFLIKKID